MQYIDWLRAQKYRPRSIETLLSLKNKLFSYLEKEGLEENQGSLQSFVVWLQNQGYSQNYQSQLLWGLETYFSYLRKIKNMEGKLRIPKLKKTNNRRKALTDKEIKQIESWLQKSGDALDKLLWALFYGCGLRREEALRLRCGDIQAEAKLLIVNGVKGGGKRVLPLSEKQLNWILAYENSERPKPKQGFENQLIIGKKGGSAKGVIAEKLKHWQEQTKLGSKLCWHVLRHSIATRLANKGLSPELISSFLGHRSMGSTSIYIHHLKKQ